MYRHPPPLIYATKTGADRDTRFFSYRGSQTFSRIMIYIVNLKTKIFNKIKCQIGKLLTFILTHLHCNLLSLYHHVSLPRTINDTRTTV